MIQTSVGGCLAGCDGGDRSSCAGTALIGRVSGNGSTFGTPEPLLANGVPVCLLHRLNGDPRVTADHRSGDVAMDVDLFTDVYITAHVPSAEQKGQVCPQCSGNAPGDLGVCIGGQDAGLPCRVDALASVPHSAGNTDYRLSTSCRPAAPLVATLSLHLALAAGTSSLAGPLPCEDQQQDDACGTGSACSAACTGSACGALVDDPSDPAHQICRDSKGGLSQVCCAGATDRPCHPTRNGGTLARSGRAAPLVPDTSNAAFPATASPVLAATFCIPSTTSLILNLVAMGLPGPGAAMLPVTARWTP